MELIQGGDYFAWGRLPGTEPYILNGPTEITGGNWIRAKIETQGHLLTIQYGGNYRGMEIDGEQDPANWPENIRLQTTLPPDTATFKWTRKKKLAIAENIINALMVDPMEHVRSFIAVVEWVHQQPADVSFPEFLAWYDTQTFTMRSLNLLKRVGDQIGLSTWDGFRDFINNHTPAQLQGEETETEEEI